jgi:hypothetical protein
VTWMWAQDKVHLPDWLRSVFPNTLYTTKDLCLPAVDLVLCDGKPPRWLSSWKFGELVVVSTGSGVIACYLPHGWNNRQCLSHQELGGLTTESTVVWAYSQWPRTRRSVTCSFTLPTAVYSVASDTILKGKRAVRPVVVRLLPTPEVLQIGGNTYHGGGLYPPNLKRPPIFLLPSVCHMPWCRRTLTESEEWMVYDVSHRVVASLKHLTAGAREAQYSALFLPGRCLQEGLKSVLTGFDLMDEGGGASLPVGR